MSNVLVVMNSEQPSQRAFFGVLALLFAASWTTTFIWCTSMSAMGEMPMPGGWNMSMTWMRMSGQTWPGSAASFLGMWVVMMVAMMLPCLVPMLLRYRVAVEQRGAARLGRLTAIVGAGYFLIWTACGLAAYLLGTILTAIEMQEPNVSRVVPVAVGVVVVIAGVVQFTSWKKNHLSCCRDEPSPARRLPPDAKTAWRLGLRLGLHCNYCSSGLTAILLAIGVMDIRVMAAITAAITIERLAPAGERVPQVIGGVIVGVGLLLIARAAGLG